MPPGATLALATSLHHYYGEEWENERMDGHSLVKNNRETVDINLTLI